MLERVTTALETIGIALLVIAAGWLVYAVTPSPLSGPAGLAAAGVSAWAASWFLQWVDARHDEGGER